MCAGVCFYVYVFVINWNVCINYVLRHCVCVRVCVFVRLYSVCVCVCVCV